MEQPGTPSEPTGPPPAPAGRTAGPGPDGGSRRGRIHWEVQPRRRAAFVGVLVLVAFSVLASVLVDFRLGGYLMSASLVIAAVLRATLPATYCLGLLVRSRQQDVTTDLLLAVVVAVLARSVPG